jgi:ABC-2 type transport system permease protein
MLPASKGLSIPQMVLAKSFHYNGVIFDTVFIGFLINYYYTGVLFGDGGLTILHVLQSALLVAIYFIFIISLLLFVSSLVKKGIIAGLTVLVFNYLLPLISSIDKFKRISPYYLFQRASDVGNAFDGTLLPSLLTTGIIIIALNWLAIYRMKNVEVV